MERSYMLVTMNDEIWAMLSFESNWDEMQILNQVEYARVNGMCVNINGNHGTSTFPSGFTTYTLVCMDKVD